MANRKSRKHKKAGIHNRRIKANARRRALRRAQRELKSLHRLLRRAKIGKAIKWREVDRSSRQLHHALSDVAFHRNLK